MADYILLTERNQINLIDRLTTAQTIRYTKAAGVPEWPTEQRGESDRSAGFRTVTSLMQHILYTMH